MHKMKSDVSSCVSVLPLIVGSTQRVDSSKARQVDVVLDDHHVSHFVVLVEAPGCVRHDHRLHAHQLEDAHGQRDLEKAQGNTNSVYNNTKSSESERVN